MTRPPQYPGRRSRRIAVLAAVLAGLLLVVGCSGGGDAAPAPSAAAVVRQAFVTTRDAGTARATVAARTGLAGQDVTVNGNGVLDLRSGSTDVTLDLPTFGGTVHVLYVGGTVYAALPAAFAVLVGRGKPWISIPLDRLGGSAAGSFAALGGLSGNPAQQLGYLQGVRDDARVIGPEPVDGTPTTHYAGVIDLDRTPAAADPATRPQVDQLKGRLGGSTVPVDVWVDGQGRLRRVTESPAGSSTTVTFSDFGVPVSVAAPPADQVADASRFLPAG